MVNELCPFFCSCSSLTHPTRFEPTSNFRQISLKIKLVNKIIFSANTEAERLYGGGGIFTVEHILCFSAIKIAVPQVLNVHV
jgi:hypothetical protein